MRVTWKPKSGIHKPRRSRQQFTYITCGICGGSCHSFGYNKKDPLTGERTEEKGFACICDGCGNTPRNCLCDHI